MTVNTPAYRASFIAIGGIGDRRRWRCHCRRCRCVATSLAPSIVIFGSRAVNRGQRERDVFRWLRRVASSMVATLIVAVVLPAAIVTVPVSAVKSSTLSAEPATE